MHGADGQATVEWVALALLAALVLGALATVWPRSTDRELGELVAKRITRAGPEAAAGHRSVPFPAAPHQSAPLPAPPRLNAPPPPASEPRAVNAFRRLRGVGEVAKRAWILCLGYRRWRYELQHPSAPTEALPLREALAIVNTCFNPYDYLLED